MLETREDREQTSGCSQVNTNAIREPWCCKGWGLRAGGTDGVCVCVWMYMRVCVRKRVCTGTFECLYECLYD